MTKKKTKTKAPAQKKAPAVEVEAQEKKAFAVNSQDEAEELAAIHSDKTNVCYVTDSGHIFYADSEGAALKYVATKKQKLYTVNF